MADTEAGKTAEGSGKAVAGTGKADNATGKAAKDGDKAKEDASQVEEAPAESKETERKQSRLPINPVLLGAIVVALVASVVTVAVVLKANRFEATCTELRLAVQDPASLSFYSHANSKLLAAKTYSPGTVTVVYGAGFGASWKPLLALEDVNVVNRSIPGQSTIQLLLRLERDVLSLEPKAMVLLLPAECVQQPSTAVLHARIMAELASGNGIEPILATIPPVPAEQDTIEGGYLGKIIAVNRELAALASEKGWTLLDIHELLVGDDCYLRPDYCADRLWPNASGYRETTDMLRAQLELSTGEATEPPEHSVRLAER